MIIHINAERSYKHHSNKLWLSLDYIINENVVCDGLVTFQSDECVMCLPSSIVNCSSFCVFISKRFYFLKALIDALLPLSHMGDCVLTFS